MLCRCCISTGRYHLYNYQEKYQEENSKKTVSLRKSIILAYLNIFPKADQEWRKTKLFPNFANFSENFDRRSEDQDTLETGTVSELERS